MSKPNTIPDAWDDDWEAVVDKPETPNSESQNAPAKLTKAERRAQHAEFNRQIWASAENPEPMVFLQAKNSIPVEPTFKPAVKLLSRKPPTTVLSPNNASAGIAGLCLDDDEDSETERRRKAEEEFAERKARAERERAEKERRYAEARERIFGSPTPSQSDSRGPSPNKSVRGKGRRRGGGRDSQPQSADQSPARSVGKQLYDPGYTPKPGSIYIQKKESGNSRPGTPNDMQQPIREPRGPQDIGRGGRGFATRGNLRGLSHA